MNEDRKKFVETVAATVKDVREIALGAVASLRSYVDSQFDGMKEAANTLLLDLEDVRTSVKHSFENVGNELAALSTRFGAALADVRAYVDERVERAGDGVKEATNLLLLEVEGLRESVSDKIAHLAASFEGVYPYVNHQVETITERANEADARVESLAGNLTALAKDVDAANERSTSALAAVNDRITEYQKTVATAATDAAIAIAAADTKIRKDLDESLAANEATWRAELAGRDEEARTENARALAESEATQVALRELREAVARLGSDLADAQARCAELERTTEAHRSALDQHAEWMTARGSDVANQRSAIDAIRSEMATLSGTASGLAEEVRRVDARVDTTDAEVAALDGVVADSGKSAKTALGALEDRLAGVEASATEAAVQRAFDAVSGQVSEARRVLAEQFAQLQQSVLGHMASIRSGEPGPAGPAGRDGRMTPPVTWAAGESYRHGDTVTHRGGLWSCWRSTDAEPELGADSGWSLVVNGIADLALDQPVDNPRQAVVLARLTSGEERRLELHIPSVIDRGVWREELVADVGDMVTHDGSAWIAKRRSIGSKPGTADAVDDWRLLVKRGKNGNVVTERPPQWKGPYEAGKQYEANDIVRAGDGIWLCLRKTTVPPSTDAPMDWVLMLSTKDDD